MIAKAAKARAGAWLSVDLAAITDNWRRLSAQLRPGCRAAAVVKADAYGLGAAAVAPALLAAGCRRFFVATIDEGIELRPLLPGAEILVLNGPWPGGEDDFAAHDLIPVLNTPAQLAGWAAFADARRLPSVLHVDTGMSRLGLAANEVAALGADRSLLERLGIILVMSHLACADEPENPMNRRQLAKFQAAAGHFPGIETSLAASSGLFLGPEWHGHWVRPGAALYGLRPSAGGTNPMAQVVRLQGRILQVRDVDAGDTVGYGATHRFARSGKLAIVAAGYADGLFRSLGNRGSGLLGGWRVPLVGRVSMDLIAFDVTATPPGEAREGGVINIIGPGNTADDVADAAGTIGYEVLTALGRRYHREYRT